MSPRRAATVASGAEGSSPVTSSHEPATSVNPSGDAASDDRLQRWITVLIDELGVDPDVVDVDGLLVLTREVAHEVLRPAVPITAFVMGYAVAQGGGNRARFDAVAAQVSATVTGWREGRAERG